MNFFRNSARRFVRRCWITASVLALAAPLASASGGILARVSDQEVRVDDVRSALEGLSPREQAALAANPALLNQAVRTLLARRVVLNEALAQGWDRNPAFTSQLDKLRENAMVESYLQAVSIPPAEFPSEQDLEAVYASLKPSLIAPAQYRIAQIFIADSADFDDAQKHSARQKQERVVAALKRADADFSALAKAESDEPVSAAQGGEIGWISDAQLRPEIRASVTALGAGQVSAPIRLDDGWHVLKKIEEQPSRQLSLDDVRAQLVQRLRGERAQSNRQRYLADLMAKNPMVINEFVLAELLVPAAKE